MALAPPIGTAKQGSINSPGSVGENSNAVVPNAANSVGSDPSGVQAAGDGGSSTGGLPPDMLAWLNEVYKNTGGATTPGGSNLQLQYNDNGSMNGSSFCYLDLSGASGQNPTLFLDASDPTSFWRNPR
jgi:hypothetical protein